jgi:hypothetical protein
VFLGALLGAVVCLHHAGKDFGDPNSAITRYRTPAVAPRVFARGRIRPSTRAADEAPLYCSVDHEKWVLCGKNYCWRTFESFRYSAASLDVTWSSSELPATIALGPEMHFEPWMSPRNYVSSGSRAQFWRDFAQKYGFGFQDATSPSHRIVEYCAEAGDPIYVEGCVSTDGKKIGQCSVTQGYGAIWNGEPEAAIDNAADYLAYYLGGAALALLVAVLAWFRAPRPIVGGLEDRAAPHRKKLGKIWLLLLIPPALGLAVIMMHASHPPSTWSTGRGGFAFALSALTGWVLFAASRIIARSRMLAALTPVLATPRSLLAEANGTVELAVKAKGTNVKTYIGDDDVAYSRITITESYRNGKNTSTQQVHTSATTDKMEVVDESGHGTLDLTNAILDVEIRSVTMPALSPRYAERGVSVGIHPSHISYTINELVITNGEALYVFGDVSNIALQASEGGYRSVTGSPTLGGRDAAPVLVHSGDERGLVAMLSRDARAANSFAVVAACVCIGICGALAVLAAF